MSNALVQAMVSDQGYREWEAVKQAVNELTGVTDWVLDPANNQIVYTVPNNAPVDPAERPDLEFTYGCSSNYQSICNYKTFETPQAVGSLAAPSFNATLNSCEKNAATIDYSCTLDGDSGSSMPFHVITMPNPAYDPAAESEREEKSIPLDVVAQKVISNAASSVEITEMMANTFIQAVKDSALNPDENKQIIKYVDILEQWEENKWQLV